MGCDIHFIIEYKTPTHWAAIPKDPWLPRNYELFGKLCDGIRGYNGKYPARGLPVDASQLTTDYSDYYDPDGHSHSWLSLDEYKDAIKDLPPHNDYLDLVMCMEEKLEQGYSDVRICFFFDN